MSNILQDQYQKALQSAVIAICQSHRYEFLKENLVIYFIEGLREIKEDDVSIWIGGNVIENVVDVME